MVVNFVRIKFSWISLGLLSMIIYEDLYTWCLRYNICSAWFLKVVSVQMSVCVCVCVPIPRLLITSGVMWHFMDPMRLVNKFYSCYMATESLSLMGVVLEIDMRRRH